MSDRVFIFDTTLRDGEQSPGATMNTHEKISMAKQLEHLGVDIIEAGFPAASQGDFEAVRDIAAAVKDVQVAGLCRAVPQDIDRAWDAIKGAKNPRIHTFIATSEIHMKYKLQKSQEEVLEMTRKAVSHAASYTKNVEWSAEDASRSDWKFLAKVTEAAIACGASTVNIPDTVGYTQPQEYYDLIRFLLENVHNAQKAVFSVHCHDDLGMAVANTLAAIRAGARQAEVTVSGIGERAGNAALEEVVMAMNTRKDLYELETGICTEQIFPSCRLLAQIIGQPIPPYKSIVGSNAFAHESGVHQDGVLKNRQTYEIMTPQNVGRAGTSIVIGKHSGSHAIKNKVKELGYDLTEEQLQIVFQAVKELADTKAQIHDEDVAALVLEKVHRRRDRFRIKDMSVFSGAGEVPPHAAVVMEFLEDGQVVNEEREACFGTGVIDAVFRALCKLVGLCPELERYQVNAVTGGTDALAGVAVRVVDQGIKAVGRGTNGDVVRASALAFVNAFNRLEKSKKEE